MIYIVFFFLLAALSAGDPQTGVVYGPQFYAESDSGAPVGIYRRFGARETETVVGTSNDNAKVGIYGRSGPGGTGRFPIFYRQSAGKIPSRFNKKPTPKPKDIMPPKIRGKPAIPWFGKK